MNATTTTGATVKSRYFETSSCIASIHFDGEHLFVVFAKGCNVYRYAATAAHWDRLCTATSIGAAWSTYSRHAPYTVVASSHAAFEADYGVAA